LSATLIPTPPALDHSGRSHEDRLEAWSRWFLQPNVLIRIVLYVVTLIYLRTVLFDYVYDDSLLITLNPWMESWKQVPQFFTHSFWAFLEIPRAMDFYRPLILLLLATVRHLLGPAPGWFHLVAVGLHVCATYLVYRLACETVADQRIAAIAAGFFGLHPTKVETAAWISGISDSLSAALFLASMIWYFKARNHVEHKLKYLLISTVLLLLGLFAKEAAIFAPVLIAIYEFSSGESRFRERCLATLRAASPFLTVAIVAILARKLLIQNQLGHGLNEIAIQPTILTAPKAIVWYLGKQLWPHELSVQYPVMLVRAFSFSQFVLPLILVLAATLGIAWVVRRKPTGIFFASWLLLMLAPVLLYFLSLQEHDRYFYLPSVASSIGAAYIVNRLYTFSIRIHAATVFVLFTLMTGLTANYESYWDNDTKLFTRAVQIAPDNSNAQEFLADTYITLGEAENAKAFAQEIINRNHGPEGWYILGNVLLSEHKNEEAREAYQTALRLWGGRHLLTSLRLADADLNLGRSEEAAQIYQELIRRFPDRAFLHGNLATALRAMGKSEEAKREAKIQKELQ